MVTMAGTAVQGQARWGIHLAAGGSSQALPRPVLGPPLLRQRMVDAMVLRGFAARTQQAYVGAVDLMARHYRVQAGSLSDEQIQAYLLHLLRQRGLSRSTVNQAACAARFMVCEVLGEVDRRRPKEKCLKREGKCVNPGSAHAPYVRKRGLKRPAASCEAKVSIA